MNEYAQKYFCLLVIWIKFLLRHWDWVSQAVLAFKLWNNNQDYEPTRSESFVVWLSTWISCLTFFELGTVVRFSRRAIFCCSISGSWFENSEKTAHSSVKCQMCMPLKCFNNCTGNSTLVSCFLYSVKS